MFDMIGARLFLIRPRRPDINPIENLFHLVKRLNRDALEQKRIQKSFQFSDRVKETFQWHFLITIESVDK